MPPKRRKIQAISAINIRWTPSEIENDDTINDETNENESLTIMKQVFLHQSIVSESNTIKK